MKMISIQVGLPREVKWWSEESRPESLRNPSPAPLCFGHLTFEGNGQADLSMHGRLTKAVYARPSEHYEYWRNELPVLDYPTGCSARTLRTPQFTKGISQ